MPAKAAFNDEQREIIRATARKLWKQKFEWMKPVKPSKEYPDGRPGGQEAMALAMGLTQQTISALINPKGKYNPGRDVATAVANLDGQTLQQLIGDYADPDSRHGDDEDEPSSSQERRPTRFTNLDKCIHYHAGSKHWNAWTIAAAQAGFFGPTDFPPPEWSGKLDALERVLEKARKAG